NALLRLDFGDRAAMGFRAVEIKRCLIRCSRANANLTVTGVALTLRPILQTTEDNDMNVEAARNTFASASQATEHFDVLIVGAGISGIGSAYHLRTQLPG